MHLQYLKGALLRATLKLDQTIRPMWYCRCMLLPEHVESKSHCLQRWLLQYHGSTVGSVGLLRFSRG